MTRSMFVLAVALAMAHGAAGAQQPVQPGSDLAVAVVVPPTMPGVDDAVRVQLESRLSQVLTGTGLAAVPGGSTLVMYPSLVVVDARTVEGLQARTVLKLDLTLYLKNASDGVLFASTSQSLAGVGPNRNAAIINAVSSMRPGDSQLQAFATGARTKINDYYARNCAQVIADGKKHAMTGDIGRAMAIFLSVPREVASCHGQASDAAAQTYAEWQERECQRRLTRGRAEAAANRYGAAIDAIEGTDPSAACARDINALITDIGREVDRRTDQVLRVRLNGILGKRSDVMRMTDTPAKLTTRRLTLAAEASVEWYNRQPRPAFSPELFKQ